MAVKDERLRERIVAHLLAAGTDSISGIARAVSRDRPRPIHRLTIAGYLAAMSEDGQLRELDRPPSKAYQIADPDAHRDIYRRVADAVREIPMPGEERTLTAVAALGYILGRPVFRAELHHARLAVPDDLPRVQCSEAERRAYRDLVPQKFPRIDVPRADPLHRVEPLPRTPEVVRRALLDAAGARAWAWDAGPGPRQAPLPLGDE